MAKVYRKETGSDLIDRLLSEPASEFLLSRLAIGEMESVFALRHELAEAAYDDVGLESGTLNIEDRRAGTTTRANSRRMISSCAARREMSTSHLTSA